MKKYFVWLISVLLFTACSKKTVPSKTNNVTIITNNNDNGNVFASDSSANNTSNPVATAVNTGAAFLVVSNAFGKIITPQQSLPDSTIHFNQLQLSKGFSAQQLSNLKARYNTIPPRVLYVNPANQLHSARGSYFILAKKFWYWKRKDGLFYLDEKYYM